MRSIEIKLHAAMPGGTQRFTYSHNGRTVDVHRVFDKPHGYIYFNYKSRTLGHFKISSVIDKLGRQQDFGRFLPAENVVNFFVYYAYNMEQPLLICIATMKKSDIVTYRYFSPEYKNSNKWNEEKDLYVDPKWSTSMVKIQRKLDEIFKIMGGAEIHIDKTQNYNQHNIVIQPYHIGLKKYIMYVHEFKDNREFILNRLRCKNEIITEIEINNPVTGVLVVSKYEYNNFKPIILCIMEKDKEKNEKTHRWYSLEDLNKDKWIHRHTHSELFKTKNYEEEIDQLYKKFHEFDIDLNTTFFNSKYKDFTNNGELFEQVTKESTTYGYSRHICKLKVPIAFKVNTMKIYGTKQHGLPVDMYHSFHVYWHEKNDPYIPFVICVQTSEKKFNWYKLKHFGSNTWVPHTDLDDADPDDNDIKEDFEKIYQELFWVDFEISYEKVKSDLKQFNKNDRYLGIRESTHNLFKRVELVNFSSYPLHVKVYLDGIKQTGIPDTDEVLSAYVFYYDGEDKTLPMFICFDMYYGYNDFRWYSRLKEDTNDWSEHKDLKGRNPNDFNFQILKTVQDGVYEYQLTEKAGDGKTSELNGVVGKAIGSSFGAAAFCGVGYLVYTNAGAILSLFR